MCTIINIHEQPVLLKEDITVYKILRRNFHSLSACFPYIKEKMYHQDIKIEPFYTKIPESAPGFDRTGQSMRIASPFDLREEDIVKNYLIKDPDNINKLRSIKEGFHFAFHKERLQNKWYLIQRDKSFFLAEFTVPKGSLVYKGLDDSLGVSNCIILNTKQPYLKTIKKSKP